MPNALLTRALNTIFPPQCIQCDALVPEHGTLCLPCWQAVSFITDPMCECCGLAFEYAYDGQALCGECMRERPPYAQARAALRYDDASRRLVTRLKYNDHTYLARIYGVWLCKAAGGLIGASDVIVPVPLHYMRFVRRRYNQSALLAQAVAKESGVTVLESGLQRTRHTTPQTGLTRTQRKDNVKGAFRANPKYMSALKGKNILLIDDVYTTGATLFACTKALIDAGATQVNVLTLTRTLD